MSFSPARARKREARKVWTDARLVAGATPENNHPRRTVRPNDPIVHTDVQLDIPPARRHDLHQPGRSDGQALRLFTVAPASRKPIKAINTRSSSCPPEQNASEREVKPDTLAEYHGDRC